MVMRLLGHAVHSVSDILIYSTGFYNNAWGLIHIMFIAKIASYVQSVQEVVTHLYSKLLYKTDIYFLDRLYETILYW